MLKRPERFPTAQSAERTLDRRRFLGVAGCAALLAAGGEWVTRRGESEARGPLDLALAEGELPPAGQSTAVAAAGGGEALVVKLEDGAVVAFDRRCPHLGCPVLWAAERGRFECPCHHAAFDARTGHVLFGPPRRGLEPARLQVARNTARGGDALARTPDRPEKES